MVPVPFARTESLMLEAANKACGMTWSPPFSLSNVAMPTFNEKVLEEATGG